MTFKPRLDAFRGLCISAVFLTHYGYLDCGWIGVQAFFVLSGYLITGILLESLDAREGARGYFVNFYMRRVLRIFPVYFFYILLTVAAGVALGGQLKEAILGDFFDHAPYLLTYTVNFYRIFVLANTALYTHLWSLSIEEQFYLVWPLVLFFTPRRAMPALCLAMIIAAPLLRLAVLWWQAQHGLPAGQPPGRFVYYFTPSYLDAFASGALLNFVRDSSMAQWMAAAAKKWALPAFLLLSAFMGLMGRLAGYDLPASSLSWIGYLPRFYAYIWGYTVLNLMFLAAIANIDAFSALLDLAPLRRLGRISYGFYIYHFSIIFLARMLIHAGGPTNDVYNLVCGCAAFAVTWGVSELSYRYLETPLLRMKDRFRSRRAASPEPAVAQ